MLECPLRELGVEIHVRFAFANPSTSSYGFTTSIILLLINVVESSMMSSMVNSMMSSMVSRMMSRMMNSMMSRMMSIGVEAAGGKGKEAGSHEQWLRRIWIT